MGTVRLETPVVDQMDRLDAVEQYHPVGALHAMTAGSGGQFKG